MTLINKKDKIFIAGVKGMVGSAIKRKLIQCGYQNLINTDKSELDLTNPLEHVYLTSPTEVQLRL